jgi:hypothetical protein
MWACSEHILYYLARKRLRYETEVYMRVSLKMKRARDGQTNMAIIY